MTYGYPKLPDYLQMAASSRVTLADKSYHITESVYDLERIDGECTNSFIVSSKSMNITAMVFFVINSIWKYYYIPPMGQDYCQKQTMKLQRVVIYHFLNSGMKMALLEYLSVSQEIRQK